MAMCHRCWQRASNATRQGRIGNADYDAPGPEIQRNADDVNVQNGGDDQDQVLYDAGANQQVFYVRDYVRAPNSSRSCCYTQCTNENLRRIPTSMKVFLVCNYRLYIPPSARICHDHLTNINIDEILHNINVTSYFNSSFFSDLTNMLVNAFNNAPTLDFESGLDAQELHFWTGLTFEQFDAILAEIPNLSERSRLPRTVLGVYLTKLRTGEPNERLATLFKISRRELERKLKMARECLTQDFVTNHLGIGHVSRRDLLARNLSIPKAIFGNEENTVLILIADGTYIYIEKSSNFLFQRKSYSLHKFRNLLKPFLLVTADGYIIDVLGPYPAVSSDATIMQNIMNQDEHLLHWLIHNRDVFILDRGFRDSIDDIQSLGYEAHMPPTKDRHATQLTTEQANKSRLVTICRWVVEAVNGKFKNRFKLLRQSYFNRALPNMFVDFRIAAAIINAFYRVATDTRLASEILNIIHDKINTPNLLRNYVEMKNLNDNDNDK